MVSFSCVWSHFFMRWAGKSWKTQSKRGGLSLHDGQDLSVSFQFVWILYCVLHKINRQLVMSNSTINSQTSCNRLTFSLFDKSRIQKQVKRKTLTKTKLPVLREPQNKPLTTRRRRRRLPVGFPQELQKNLTKTP